MQIKYETARGMGYKGEARGLLDRQVNLTYGIPYLANAYHLADGNENRATALYRGGYYYLAKCTKTCWGHCGRPRRRPRSHRSPRRCVIHLWGCFPSLPNRLERRRRAIYHKPTIKPGWRPLRRIRI